MQQKTGGYGPLVPLAQQIGLKAESLLWRDLIRAEDRRDRMSIAASDDGNAESIQFGDMVR